MSFHEDLLKYIKQETQYDFGTSWNIEFAKIFQREMISSS